MYKVIGSDNREYGPANEEAVRRWIAEGRANAATQAQKEGETGWRPLSTFAEFAGALAAGAAPPLAAGATGAAAVATGVAGATWSSGAAGLAIDANALATELCARDFQLDIGGCVQRSWDLIQKHFWLVIAAWAVSFLVACGIFVIPYVGPSAFLVLGAVLLGGLHWFFLRLQRGEPASVADVFAGFGKAIGPLILCGIVSSLLTGVGLVLCLVPGIYLAVCWHFAALLILDKRLEFWAAMELSRKVVTRHWWGVFGLMLVAILLWIGGLLACCIGIFITAPIATGAIVQAYRGLFDQPSPQPASQPGVAAA
jgi:hypothetical protein